MRRKHKKKSKLQKHKDDPNSVYWRRKADRLWSERVRERDGGKCVICGESKNVQTHHLIDRSVKHLRHRLENGVTLCPRCHKFDRRISAHRGAIPFSERLRDERPEQFKWVMDHYLFLDDAEWDYRGAYWKLGGNNDGDVV